jgi:hypothetical protein
MWTTLDSALVACPELAFHHELFPQLAEGLALGLVVEWCPTTT